jgi:CarD family transcriptional regulator, regulator of rRNA transcription
VTVGDSVVYAAHGVGLVIDRARTQVAGTERDCIVVELASGLRVTLPIEEAADRLRAVADDAEIKDISRTLASEPSGRDGAWTRRVSENKAKLASGRPTELAELVRDGRCLDGPSLRASHTERRVYLQARELLVRELCSALEIEPDAADAWIEAQMPPPDERI